jgi:hypothetical protein
MVRLKFMTRRYIRDARVVKGSYQNPATVP